MVIYMRIRNDFVSNSSSCSFIVQITNADKKQKFLELVEKFKLQINEFWDENVEDIDKGDWYNVYCGEDSFENVDRFEQEIIPKVEEINLKCFRDEYEHCSYGRKLRRKKRK